MKKILIILLCLGTCLAFAGDAPITGMKLTTDQTIDMTQNELIIKQVCKDDMTPQQKCIALWRTIISRSIHKENVRVEDRGNISELMIKYGQALCGTYGHNFGQLLAGTGLPATRVGLKGHWVCAVKYWGDWHTYDADMWNFYAKPNGIVASPGEIRRLKDKDGKHVLRMGPPVRSYPWYIGSDTLKGLYSLYGTTSIGNPYPAKVEWKWKYGLNLRPGMELVFSWYPDPDVGFVSLSHVPKTRNPRKHKTLREYLEDDYDYYQRKKGKEKYHWGYRRGGLRSNARQAWNGVGSNGRVVYNLSAEKFRNAQAMMLSSDNIQIKDGKLGLTDTAKDGIFELDFDSPYVYGDAWVEKPVAEGIKLDLFDGKRWREVYPKGGVDDGKRIRFFDAIRGASHVKLKVTLKAGSKPVETFKTIAVFHLNWKTLPGLVKGKNRVNMNLADPKALKQFPLHVTYVYNMVSDKKEILRHEKTLTFTPAKLSVDVDTGDKHWPLNREIRMRCGGKAPADPKPAEEKGELDWGAVPWDWCYWKVNFWNDFERGERIGWAASLTTKDPYAGDFCLDNSLMSKDGSRQLKVIWFGAWLNHGTKFRCEVYVKNVAKLHAYVRNQGDYSYPGLDIEGLKDGEWQTIQFNINDCSIDGKKKPKVGDFMTNVYIVARPAEGKEKKDVVFKIDNTICWDGELKYDPFKDPEALKKTLAEDLTWNAKPEEK